jgi:hypothetical protein
MVNGRLISEEFRCDFSARTPSPYDPLDVPERQAAAGDATLHTPAIRSRYPELTRGDADVSRRRLPAA